MSDPRSLVRAALEGEEVEMAVAKPDDATKQGYLYLWSLRDGVCPNL
jgi:hypothetical protein